MITVDSFIAELKSQYSSYADAGLIDEISIYGWVNEAVKKFGENVMTLQDTVVEVKNSQATLPDNYFSLYVAYKCDKKGYYIEDSKDIPQLQQSYMWVERVEKGNKWNLCEPCCTEDVEKTIVERVYYNGIETQYHYHNPVLLKLGKSMQRSRCHAKCRNLIVKDSPHEIIINSRTLTANFHEGDIYLQFYGLPQDEEGRPMIPDTPKGEVMKYVEYYVKRNFFEGLLANGDDKAATLFNYYVQKEDSQLGLALTDAKFSTLTPNSFKRLKKINRAEMMKYELMFPIV